MLPRGIHGRLARSAYFSSCSSSTNLARWCARSSPTSQAHRYIARAMPLTAIDLGQCQFERARLFSITFSICSRLGIGRPLTGQRWMLINADEMFAGHSSGDLREGSTSGFPSKPGKHATACLAVGVTLALSVSFGVEPEGAPFGGVRSWFRVPPADLWSLIVDPADQEAHVASYFTDFRSGFFSSAPSRRCVKNSRTLSKVVVYLRSMPPHEPSTSTSWSTPFPAGIS